jgi:uncharacterized membrane protein
MLSQCFQRILFSNYIHVVLYESVFEKDPFIFQIVISLEKQLCTIILKGHLKNPVLKEKVTSHASSIILLVILSQLYVILLCL